MADALKYKHAELLNRLSDMQQAPYYATACHTLVQAEMAIVGLEDELRRLAARVTELEALEPTSRAGAVLGQMQAALEHARSEIERLKAAAQESALQALVDSGQYIEETGRLRQEIKRLIKERDECERRCATLEAELAALKASAEPAFTVRVNPPGGGFVTTFAGNPLPPGIYAVYLADHGIKEQKE